MNRGSIFTHNNETGDPRCLIKCFFQIYVAVKKKIRKRKQIRRSPVRVEDHYLNQPKVTQIMSFFGQNEIRGMKDQNYWSKPNTGRQDNIDPCNKDHLYKTIEMEKSRLQNDGLKPSKRITAYTEQRLFHSINYSWWRHYMIRLSNGWNSIIRCMLCSSVIYTMVMHYNQCDPL